MGVMTCLIDFILHKASGPELGGSLLVAPSDGGALALQCSVFFPGLLFGEFWIHHESIIIDESIVINESLTLSRRSFTSLSRRSGFGRLIHRSHGLLGRSVFVCYHC